MATAIYPYEQLEFGAELKIQFSGDIPERTNEFVYSFVGMKRPALITGEITVKVPDSLDRFFPPSESFKSELDVVVVWQCDRSRRRGIIALTPDAKYRIWTAALSLGSKHLAGFLKFKAYGVRKSASAAPQLGFASHKATVLFSSKPEFVVEIDQPLDRQGADLESKWVDFTDPSAGQMPNDYPRAVYHLSLDMGEPILYMNKALPDELKTLLTHEKQRGVKAAARDAFFAPIEADVWEQLATDALLAFAENSSSFDGLDPWRVGVLQALAKELTKKNDQKSAETEMTKWDSARTHQVIEKVLPMALQQHVSLSTAFNSVSGEVLK